MSSFIINGLFLSQQLSGAQRYALEILKELDKVVNRGYIEIAVPIDAQVDADLFCNVAVNSVGKHHGRIWEQLDLPQYIRKNRAIGLSLCNTAPLLKPDIVAILDVGYRNWRTIKEVGGKRQKRISRDLQNACYCNFSKKIVTLTEHSKSEIVRFFHVRDSKLSVVGCGWQHYEQIDIDERIFDDYPSIEKGNYYYAMSNLSEHKNFKWILEAAARNPKFQFVISGSANPRHFVFSEDFNRLENVIYLGRVNDECAKALMKSCRAFISPSCYEGFGLTPLEALCLGKKIIISDIPAHKEVYGNTACYIDPHRYDYDLSELVDTAVEDPKDVLGKYSWENSAVQIKLILERFRRSDG